MVQSAAQSVNWFYAGNITFGTAAKESSDRPVIFNGQGHETLRFAHSNAYHFEACGKVVLHFPVALLCFKASRQVPCRPPIGLPDGVNCQIGCLTRADIQVVLCQQKAVRDWQTLLWQTRHLLDTGLEGAPFEWLENIATRAALQTAQYISIADLGCHHDGRQVLVWVWVVLQSA